jgi:hypothetical protein
VNLSRASVDKNMKPSREVEIFEIIITENVQMSLENLMEWKRMMSLSFPIF